MHSQLPPLHFVTQLWGASYVRLFADYTLQMLGCEGNLPTLSTCSDAVYEIHTTPEDQAALKANANFKKIVKAFEGWLKFSFVTIEGEIGDPYVTMSACHRRAIAEAERRNAALIFLQPDCIVGNGTLRTVRDKLLEGKRLVMAPGMRAHRERMEEILRPAGEHNALCMPVRDLVAHAVEHMHPVSRALLWENGHIASYCSHLFWRIGKHSLYARCAHNHPLMVYPRVKGCGFNHTIDWDYFYRACPDLSDWFIACSSDEVCLIELSALSKFEGQEHLRPSTPDSLAFFLASHTESFHLPFLTTPFLYAGTSLELHDWVEQNREAECTIHEALTLLKPCRVTLPSLLHLARPVERMRSWLVVNKARLSQASEGNVVQRTLIYYPFLVGYSVLRFIWRLRKTLF